jgi:enamine deaminase RidA (YjgF/YER057c/UK114 family)
MALTDRGSTKKQIVDGCIPAEMTFGAAAVRAGDLLLCSGMMAADASGPIAGMSNAAPFAHFGAGARAQMEYIVGALKAVCAAGGSSIERVLRIHQFHPELGELYPMHRAWQAALGDAPVPFTAVQVPAPLPVPACSVIVDAWFYAP